jgi:four helix bundle protein
MRFEKMDIWERAVTLSTGIYRYSPKLKDYGFNDQITRSGLSIPSNIAEGLERDFVKDSVKFLLYAKASGGELYTQIIVGRNCGFIEFKQAEIWLNEIKEITAILGAIINKRKEFS